MALGPLPSQPHLSSSAILPRALGNQTGGVSRPAHQPLDLADGVEGRLNLHVPLTAKPSSEDGFELRGCALPWRDGHEDVLYAVESARSVWQRWAVGDGSAVPWTQQHSAELICLCNIRLQCQCQRPSANHKRVDFPFSLVKPDILQNPAQRELGTVPC